MQSRPIVKIEPMTDLPREMKSQGIVLSQTLHEATASLLRLGWSPDSRRIAASTKEGIVRVWNAADGALEQTAEPHTRAVGALQWSPRGELIASGSADSTISVWSAEDGRVRWAGRHKGFVHALAWSPDSSIIVSASSDQTMAFWDVQSGTQVQSTPWRWRTDQRIVWIGWSPNGKRLAYASERSLFLVDWPMRKDKYGDEAGPEEIKVFPRLLDAAWSPNSKVVACAHSDGSIHLWDTVTRRESNVLEGHVGGVISVSFSPDGRLLASKSSDGTFRVWNCRTWETVAVISEPTDSPLASLAFGLGRTHGLVLATLGEHDHIVRLWAIEVSRLLRSRSKDSAHYRNAKVLLVGDSGVGKTGLSLVLLGEDFVPTDSTHGRKVWTLAVSEIAAAGITERRETLLWDLAGQPGYRLIHQLHLDDVAVALVVFDGRSDIDPFGGVNHWNRALSHAKSLQGSSGVPLTKFLVAARADRGGIPASAARISVLVAKLGFDQYFETSAKESWGTSELLAAIHKAIVWSTLPRISSTVLFQRIKSFITSERASGQQLSSVDDLHHAFLRAERSKGDQDTRAEFTTCVRLLESRGIVKRLSFGGLVLLQPELLDAYASVVLNAARTEPDGLGTIPEEIVLTGRFRMPETERIRDREKEPLLLIATVEELLRREITLREHTEEGIFLVFPSESTKELPEMPQPKEVSILFRFEGPILSIYATLVIRLVHSGGFRVKEIWRNGALFHGKLEGLCGLFVREPEEGLGELALFFREGPSVETQYTFEEYIRVHVERKAVPESVERQRLFRCPKCGVPIPAEAVAVVRRRQQNERYYLCNVCVPPTKAWLLDTQERLGRHVESKVPTMDVAADAGREVAAATAALKGKIATGDFDVFIAHSSADKPEIRDIAASLKSRGLYPWLDEEQIPPGRSFQSYIQEALARVKAAAVFFGPRGVGKWQGAELEALMSLCREKGLPVLPVLLPKVDDVPSEFLFLRSLNWVRFTRVDDEVALDSLEWGITGVHPRRK